MTHSVPKSVLDAPPHSLVLVPGDSAVEFYVREDEFVQASYPRHCGMEFALGSWDEGKVLGISLLVQLGGRNASTFDHWINAAERSNLRALQLLSTQGTLDLYLVSDRVQRSFRGRNTIAGQAAGLIATLRLRPAWTNEEFDEWRSRLDTLYPTPDALWRGARKQKR